MASSRPDNLYQVIGLRTPTSSTAISEDELKSAVRTALLRQHPDKQTLSDRQTPTELSLDDILRAKAVLLNSRLREEYDRHLALQKSAKSVSDQGDPSALLEQIEVADLDDFAHDPDAMSWSQDCSRCGQTGGFKLSEQELSASVLESATAEQTIVLSCDGCSLLKAVTYRLAPD